MRISDWSSDVCSSDLLGFNDSAAGFLRRKVRAREKHHADRKAVGQGLVTRIGDRIVEEADGQVHVDASAIASLAVRSEEHTSELQSLMRISYAVFCLKKKKKNN